MSPLLFVSVAVLVAEVAAQTQATVLVTSVEVPRDFNANSEVLFTTAGVTSAPNIGLELRTSSTLAPVRGGFIFAINPIRFTGSAASLSVNVQYRGTPIWDISQTRGGFIPNWPTPGTLTLRLVAPGSVHDNLQLTCVFSYPPGCTCGPPGCSREMFATRCAAPQSQYTCTAPSIKFDDPASVFNGCDKGFAVEFRPTKDAFVQSVFSVFMRVMTTSIRSSVPAATTSRTAVELIATRAYLPRTNATSGSKWFEIASTASPGLAFGFVQSVFNATPELELGGFVPATPTSNWPPPPGSQLASVTVGFDSPLYGVARRIAFRANDTWFPLATCDSSTRITYDFGQFDFRFSASQLADFINTPPCSAASARVRVALALEGDLAWSEKVRMWPILLSRVRIVVLLATGATTGTAVLPGGNPFGVLPGGLPPGAPPAATSVTSTFVAGAVSGGPAGWLSAYNAFHAFQRRAQAGSANIAVALPDNMFAVNQVFVLRFSRFNMLAALGLGGVRRFAVAVDHAVLRTAALLQGSAGAAAFEWRAVRLVAVSGAVVAVAANSSLQLCDGSQRAWPAELCRSSGRCLSTIEFSDWRSPSSAADVVTIEPAWLRACEFAIELEFERKANDGVGPLFDDSVHGLGANGLLLALPSGVGTGPLVAVLGPLRVSVEQAVTNATSVAKGVVVTSFVSGQLTAGGNVAINARLALAELNLTRGGAPAPRITGVLESVEPGRNPAAPVLALPQVPPPRVAPPNDSAPRPLLAFEVVANFSAELAELPVSGVVRLIEIELTQWMQCAVPFDAVTRTRRAFLKDRATVQAELCGVIVDKELVWTLADGRKIVVPCLVTPPWPLAREQRVVFYEPAAPTMIRPGDLYLNGASLAVRSELLQPHRLPQGSPAPGATMGVRVRVHFEDVGVVQNVPSGCSLRSRRDGTALLELPSTSLPAAALMSMWVRPFGTRLAARPNLLLTFATPVVRGAVPHGFRLQLRDNALELLELRPDGAAVAPTNSTTAAVDEAEAATATDIAVSFALLLSLPMTPAQVAALQSGAYVHATLLWDAKQVCVLVGVSVGESARCVPGTLAAAGRTGALSLGGQRSLAGSPTEIDNFLVSRGDTSTQRRSRPWYDPADPLLALVMTFQPRDGTSECTCGSNVDVAADVNNGVGAMLLSSPDCNRADCSKAPLLEVPGAFDGTVSQLAGDASAAQLAAHATRLCNASVDAVPLPKLSHMYRVRGNGTLITASTCRNAVQDTRLFVFRASLCGMFADTSDRSKCVASNDDSLRGPRGCPNGGAEVTWRAEAGVEYLVVVATPFELPSAQQPRSFTLDVESCAVPRCASLPSCIPCNHLVGVGAPHRIDIRDAGMSRNLAIESRCVGLECEASSSLRLRVAVHSSLTAQPAAALAGAPLTFQRGNARVTLTPIAVLPAVYVEPDFNSTLGNDNELFLAQADRNGARSRAEAQLQFYCANPLPLRYRIVLWDRALGSELLVTNVTCEATSDGVAAGSAPVVTLKNAPCQRKLYEVARIRCNARALPVVNETDAQGRAVAVCRPDLELAGVRAAVEADAAQSDALRRLVEDALALNQPAVDCNVPPIPSTVLNCSSAALQNLTAKGLRDQLGAAISSRFTGSDAARAESAESLRATRDAARCEAKQREQEARDKVALALAKDDCWDCRTGPGVVVELLPEFGDETLCFVQQRRVTALQARVTIELDGTVVFNNVTVPITQLGIGAGADAFRALFDVADPPADAILRRGVGSSNFDLELDLATAPADWVPFADGNGREWANDTCVRVPTSLESASTAEGLRPFAKTRAAAWTRLKDADKRAYLAAQQSALGALVGDATKQFASAAISQTGTGVPIGVAGVWQHLSEGGAATQRLTRLAFSSRGSLVGGLAPRGKVDESSVTAQIRVDVSSDPVYDTVAIALQGQLFNVFNNSGEAYTFEVHCREANGLLLASWDVLQRVNETFRLESTLYFVADAATRNSSDTFQRYTTSYTIEIRDSTSLFAVLPSVNQTELSLYEAEQEKRADELDARLLPLIYFFGAGPAAALLVFIAGAVLQKLRPVTDDDLYPRHIWVIVLYVAVRIVRSILLTTTAFRIIMGIALREPLATLEQLPIWVDSMSNKSSEITNLANAALNSELDRQSLTFAAQQSRCKTLLDQITLDARDGRLAIELKHATEKDARNIAALQTQIAEARTRELMSMSDAMLEYERAQTLCWKTWSAQLFNASFNYEAQFKARVNANLRGVNANLAGVNAKFKTFRADYEAFGARSLKMAGDAQALFDSFRSFARTVDDIDFLNIGPNPRGLIDPPDFIDGPLFDFADLSVPNASAWQVDLSLPDCHCDDPPPPPPGFVTNDTQAVRNYTAFAPEEVTDDEATSSAVPIPSISLRSFVSLPVLVDLFGWLPDFGFLAGLLAVVDILLIVFTHIRTIQGVAMLVRGHLFDDEILRDEALGARFARACGCACGAALIGCLMRAVDCCEVAMRRYRAVLIKTLQVVFNALLGMVALALFALGMYILAEAASAIITVQALDGLGVIGAIVSPVTSALGSANVKAIENARVINKQTLLSARNAYNQALFEIARTTNDFNDAQLRDIDSFNAEYCQLFGTLKALQKMPAPCTNQVTQTIATVVLEECPFFEEIVPRLYADVSRNEFRALVIATIEPFVSALRVLVLDCIWFFAYVVIAIASTVILGTVLYYLLVAVYMIRRRKRVVFENERALVSKYTTRKDNKHVHHDDRGDRVLVARVSKKKSIHHNREMQTVREDAPPDQAPPHENESHANAPVHESLPGGTIKAGSHVESVMQRLPSSFGRSPSQRSQRRSRRATVAGASDVAGAIPPPLAPRSSSSRRKVYAASVSLPPPPPPAPVSAFLHAPNPSAPAPTD